MHGIVEQRGNMNSTDYNHNTNEHRVKLQRIDIEVRSLKAFDCRPSW